MAEFGDWLYRIRKQAGITQRELAKRSGCSVSYISTLERGAVHSGSGGEIRPSEEVVSAIANALNAPLNQARLAAGYKPLDVVYKPKPGNGADIIHEPMTDEEKRRFISTIQDFPKAVRENVQNMLDAVKETLPKSRS
jgi:transcriptional regulator with XRE-family HTH domain